MAELSRILVISPGEGDALARLLQAIRDYHPRAHMVLLKNNQQSDDDPKFEEVWTKGDDGLLAVGRRIRAARFERIYDLEASYRTNVLFHLQRPRTPEWSGVAWGCSHPHANPRRRGMSLFEARREQLLMAGISA